MTKIRDILIENLPFVDNLKKKFSITEHRTNEGEFLIDL
jgi:hypothetical protein